MMAPAAPVRFRLGSRPTAVVLGCVVLALVVAALPLGMMLRPFAISDVGQIALILTMAAVGMLVTWRQPRQPMGWILLADAGFFVLNDEASAYSVLVYGLHRRLPLGPVAVLLQPSWAPAIVLFGLAILLFPDGRVPSPGFRWVLWAYLTVAALWMAGAFAIAATAIVRHNLHVDSGGNLLILAHPTGRTAWWGVVQNLFFPLLGACWLASVAGQAASYRRASGERRQQLKWLMGGAAISLTAGALTISASNAHGFWYDVSQAALFGLAALPVSIGVAVLKYRLYEIDRLISRTLAYAIVTGLLIGVYVGIVTLAGQALPSKPVWVAASTLAAAALFNPLRRRVQRVVDRRFNRARYDADRTIAAFAARLQDSVDPGAVREDLTAVVQRSLEPAHVSVWLTGGHP